MKMKIPARHAILVVLTTMGVTPATDANQMEGTGMMSRGTRRGEGTTDEKLIGVNTMNVIVNVSDRETESDMTVAEKETAIGPDAPRPLTVVLQALADGQILAPFLQKIKRNQTLLHLDFWQQRPIRSKAATEIAQS